MKSLPIIDLAILSAIDVSPSSISELSAQLGRVFETTGFAYLINPPLTSTDEDVFELVKDFFKLSLEDKMAIAKTSIRKSNRNTYRGYFPVQSGSDNLKEGFDLGPPGQLPKPNLPLIKINLAESNVWPALSAAAASRTNLERLHAELQELSATILSLLALALGKPPEYFAYFLTFSISTLRLLHYPPPSTKPASKDQPQPLVCTPHTDSGLLTLLYQDSNGGLEVRSADGKWIPAPYVPGSLVVNVGDLMSIVSGARFKATEHRVRSSGNERYSVPFFFEPGVDCVVKAVGEVEEGGGVVYGTHVLGKMKEWVEFQD